MSTPTPSPRPRVGRQWVQFLAVFALIFLGGSKLHQLTRERTAPIMVGVLNTQVSAAVINLITPSEKAKAVRNQIIGSTAINVGQGCDGADGILLLVAAVLAFPLAWKKKAVGLGAGLALLYVGNLLRIVALYYVQGHAPDAFEFLHEYVGQTFIIMLAFVFFMVWSGAATARPKATA